MALLAARLGPRDRIELLANLATIVVAGIMGVALVKAYFLHPSAPRRQAPAPAVTVGSDLKQVLPMDYQRNKATLILAISARCHFCNDSVPFFQKLASQVGDKLKTIAIFPESVLEGRKYLADKGLPVGDVRQVFLAGIGVTGTPTILLVDESGIVRKIWIGKLSTEDQEQALAVLTAWHS